MHVLNIVQSNEKQTILYNIDAKNSLTQYMFLEVISTEPAKNKGLNEQITA